MRERKQTPFEQAGYTEDTKFKVLKAQYGLSKGEIVTLDWDDRSGCPRFKSDSGTTAFLFFNTGVEHDTDLEVHVEESDSTSITKLEFPCCVPTSEIKDAKTLRALVDLFEANGATVYDGVDCAGGTEFGRVNSWDYFGVSLRAGSCTFRTDFYDDFEDYNQSEVSSELTMYHVSNLLGAGNVEGNGGEIPSVASQEAITERLGDNPSVGIDYSVMGTTASVDPLITITQEVKYTVVIKGITFTLTQNEIDGLAEELLGFTTL